MASAVTTRGGRTRIPRLVYGTAWKGERTAELVYEALQAGFRAVDTAAQPRHYREDLVAEGVRRALADGVVASRRDLYIQTKFTPPGGQDLDPAHSPNGPPPYDPAAPVAEQVRASVESSLRRFALGAAAPYLDCLVLHSPLPRRADAVAVWTALRDYVADGRIRTLGISNVDLPGLEQLFDVAAAVAASLPAGASSLGDRLRPAVVQNRFHHLRHSADPYDVALRRFCAHPDRRVVYQSFWTLTANPRLLRTAPSVQAVAEGAQVSREVALYGLVTLGLGGGGGGGGGDGGDGGDHGTADSPGSCPVVILDGTTSRAHMAADLAGLAAIEAWAEDAQGRAAWAAAATEFRQRIRDM